MSYKPSTPFNVPLLLLIPTQSQTLGVVTKAYTDSPSVIIYGSFRTFGGTETQSNGALVVEDTATIETWFDPRITADCRIALADNSSAVYEILGTPEDIGMRHQYMSIRARRVKGGA